MKRIEERRKLGKVFLKVPSKMFFLGSSPYLMFIYSHHMCGGKAEMPLKKPRYNKSFSVIET